jgi:uncharacterized OB-fold protein
MLKVCNCAKCGALVSPHISKCTKLVKKETIRLSEWGGWEYVKLGKIDHKRPYCAKCMGKGKKYQKVKARTSGIVQTQKVVYNILPHEKAERKYHGVIPGEL